MFKNSHKKYLKADFIIIRKSEDCGVSRYLKIYKDCSHLVEKIGLETVYLTSKPVKFLLYCSSSS